MKTKEIQVSCKISFQKYGEYFTYAFQKTVELESGDNEDDVKKQLWNEAYEEVQSQIDET